tara:strand:+ start:312 stop:584 length:273 start_codon:yes stop_codon:yes gene_type:complete
MSTANLDEMDRRGMFPGIKKEMVNHPTHYKPDGSKYEAIDVIEDWNLGFNDGNAVKYICRHRFKESAIQDIEKAIWYLQRHLENLKKEAR